MIEIVHADFMQLDQSLWSQFDHFISDPPYSGHVHANATSTRAPERGGPTARDFGFDALDGITRERVCQGMSRVRHWSVIFSDFAKGSDEFGEASDDELEAAAQAGHNILEGDCAWRALGVHHGSEWIRLVPWVRWSQAQITGDRPPSGAEAVLNFHAMNRGPRGGRKPIKKIYNGSGSWTHFDWESLRGDDKHPTEKPLALMLDIVCAYTSPGEAVLDTFGGRGTTAQACRLLGRECVCVERLEHHAEAARIRLASPLDARDLEQAKKWAKRRYDEAEREIELYQQYPTTIRRAESRIADVQRMIALLGAA